MEETDKAATAVRVAKLYYHHHLTTGAIARELNVSRSTISRLLSYAHDKGYVEIHVSTPQKYPRQLEEKISADFHLRRVHVVPVSEQISAADRLERVAQYTAKYLNTIFVSNMTLGIAWGTTISEISRNLLPKATQNSHIVQMNGAGNLLNSRLENASEVMMRFGQNYQAAYHLFPGPPFFDRSGCKAMFWEEAAVRRLLKLQQQASLLLFSLGPVNAGIPSHVFMDDYMNKGDYAELKREQAAGEIATLFYREDGTFNDIALNRRASGADPDLLMSKHSICVVAGIEKVRGLHAALLGGLIKELILDEPAARRLVEDYSS